MQIALGCSHLGCTQREIAAFRANLRFPRLNICALGRIYRLRDLDRQVPFTFVA